MLAALIAGTLAVPAGAAPRCPFLTDPAGDTGDLVVVPDDALDLRSVDIASDGKTLTMVARVTSLTLPPATSPTGSLYEFQFQADEVYFIAAARYSPVEGPSFHLKRVNGHVGGNGAYTPTPLPSKTTGRFDPAKRTVTVHVPVADLNKVINLRRGEHIAEIGAITWRTGGLKDVDSFVASADFADSRRTYVVGAKSCITAGR